MCRVPVLYHVCATYKYPALGLVKGQATAAHLSPPFSVCYDPGPYHQFSAIFHHLFRALGHLFPTRSLTRRSDRHQIT